MAWNKSYPDPIRKRHLLYPGGNKTYDWLSIGRAFLEDERYMDALQFLNKADATEELQSIREHAIAEGDVFLLTQFEAITDEEVEKETWEKIARTALEKGKKHHARAAFEQAENEEEFQKLVEEIGEPPTPPQGKEE